jgi:hypothetical protein
MNLLDLSDEKFKTIKVKGQQFKIRFITPLDRVKVSQRRMQLQNGQPLSAMTDMEYVNFENIAMIDICTEEMPKDFNASESCINWPDQELIDGLAKEIRNHTSDIETRLKKNKPID